MEAQYEIQGQRKTGTIRRVTDNGLLLLEMDGEERSFDLKEISFIPLQIYNSKITCIVFADFIHLLRD